MRAACAHGAASHHIHTSCCRKILLKFYISRLYCAICIKKNSYGYLALAIRRRGCRGARCKPCSRLCLGSCTAPIVSLQAFASKMRLIQHQ